MTRHVKILQAPTFGNNTESDPATTLAKQVYDLVATATAYTITQIRLGQTPAVLVVYDTA